MCYLIWHMEPLWCLFRLIKSDAHNTIDINALPNKDLFFQDHNFDIVISLKRINIKSKSLTFPSAFT